jgi:DNA-binding MarR family transcriptional regulator
MTALIDRLEAAGHVARREDPGDGRRQIVVARHEPLAVAAGHFAELVADCDRVIDALRPVQRACLEEVLAAFAALHEQHADRAALALQAKRAADASPVTVPRRRA